MSVAWSYVVGFKIGVSAHIRLSWPAWGGAISLPLSLSVWDLGTAHIPVYISSREQFYVGRPVWWSSSVQFVSGRPGSGLQISDDRAMN